MVIRGHIKVTARVAATRPAYTLVELVVNLAITGILLTALTSAVFFVTRGMPSQDKPADQVNLQSPVLDQLIGELQCAQFITERTASAITFTVADRDADGLAERIRYAWSGKGNPLTRQYNSGQAVAVLDGVKLLSLTYDVASVPETYPGPLVDSTEVLVGSLYAALILADVSVDKDHWIGQYFSPPLTAIPADSVAWRVTRVQFVAKRHDSSPQDTRVQIRPADAGDTPSPTILTEVLMNEGSLQDSYQWKEIIFGNYRPVSLATGLCLVLARNGSGTSAKIRYDALLGEDRLTTSNAGSSWSIDSSGSMYYYAWGKPSVPGPPQTATRQYVTGVRIALQTGTDAGARVDVSARTLNAPELLSAVWEAEFDVDPTALDVSRDDVADWERDDRRAFDPASLVKGVWQADATLDTLPANDFTALTTVEVRFRNTSVGGDGAVFAINADLSPPTSAPLTACLQLQADGTQTLNLYCQQSATTRVLLVSVPGWSRDLLTLRLLIDPMCDTVNVKANGVDNGTFTYTPTSPPSNDRFATITASGSTAEFDYVRIRVGGN